MIKRELKKKTAKKAKRVSGHCRFISCSGKMITAKEHSYAWSGRMPCTGMWRCVRCGKPEDSTTFNGKPRKKS